MRPLAIGLASGHLVLTSIASWLLMVASVISWNDPDGEVRGNEWLMWAAATLFLLSVALVASVALNRLSAALAALALHMVVVLAVSGFAIDAPGDVDPDLLLYAVALELPGTAAVAACAREARRTRASTRCLAAASGRVRWPTRVVRAARSKPGDR